LLRLIHGGCVAKDHVEAAKYFEKLADRGNAESPYYHGEQYIRIPSHRSCRIPNSMKHGKYNVARIIDDQKMSKL
jgi:TPR repeat protein